jgi:altronate dehydratase
MAEALKINAGDNVAVVLSDVKNGEEVGVMTDTDVVQIHAQQDIAFGHKIALGWVTDPIVAAGGRAIFTEVTELIGVEQILAARAELLGHDELFCITRI